MATGAIWYCIDPDSNYGIKNTGPVIWIDIRRGYYLFWVIKFTHTHLHIQTHTSVVQQSNGTDDL